MKGHDLYQLDPVTVSRGEVYNFIVLMHNELICLKGDLLKWRSLTMKYIPFHPLSLFSSTLLLCLFFLSRAHKNGWLEQKRVTPIEAHSPGKIIELLLKKEYPVRA